MFKKLVLIGLAVLLAGSLEAADEWQLRKDHDGIQVYVRDTSNEGGLKEFKGICVVEARLETVAELMRDVPGCTEWMADTIIANPLEKIDDYHYIVHNVTALPWPVSDREMVVDITVKMDYRAGQADIHMNSINDSEHLANLDSNRIRMKNSEVIYTLEYVDREHTRITFFASLNIGGYIPPSVGNLVIVSIPYRTLKDMRRLVATEKYIEAGRKSVDLPMIEQAIADGHLKAS